MIIYGGENEMLIDVWSMVVKIIEKRGCPKQSEENGDALNKLTVWGCPK